MNYIILDFEWDGTYYRKIGRFINQILQIGAVKLDEDFNVIDTFDRIIKSAVSNRVSKRFSELTGFKKEDLLCGVSINTAVNEYNDWVGDNAVTMTWSNSDLYTLLENEKYLMNDCKLKIEKYLDLQKYIQGEMRILGIELNSQISLANAANLLNVQIDESILHNAKEDSLACAVLLKRYYNADRFNVLIQDTSNPEFLERLSFKPYYISNIEDVDRGELEFSCPDCEKPLTVTKDWRFKCGTFFADMHCDNCDKNYSARARFRKYYDRIKIKKNLVEIKPKEQQNDDM